MSGFGFNNHALIPQKINILQDFAGWVTMRLCGLLPLPSRHLHVGHPYHNIVIQVKEIVQYKLLHITFLPPSDTT